MTKPQPSTPINPDPANPVPNAPEHPDLLACIFLRGHARLLAVGLKNSKMTKTQIMRLVSKQTGNSYRITGAGANVEEYERAASDLTFIIEREKARTAGKVGRAEPLP